jgi:hypothetical protein
MNGKQEEIIDDKNIISNNNSSSSSSNESDVSNKINENSHTDSSNGSTSNENNKNNNMNDSMECNSSIVIDSNDYNANGRRSNSNSDVYSLPFEKLVSDFDLDETLFASSTKCEQGVGDNRGDIWLPERGKKYLRPLFPTLKAFEEFDTKFCKNWNYTSFMSFHFCLQAVALGAYDFTFKKNLGDKNGALALHYNLYGIYDCECGHALIDMIPYLVPLFGVRLDKQITMSVRKRLLRLMSRYTPRDTIEKHWTSMYTRICMARGDQQRCMQMAIPFPEYERTPVLSPSPSSSLSSFLSIGLSQIYTSRLTKKKLVKGVCTIPYILNELYSPWRQVSYLGHPEVLSLNWFYSWFIMTRYELFGPSASVLDKPVVPFLENVSENNQSSSSSSSSLINNNDDDANNNDNDAKQERRQRRLFENDDNDGWRV